MSIQRLGIKSEQEQRQPGSPRSRPIKVVLKNADDRKKILESGRKLKEENGRQDLQRIFLKMDTHPGVRREQRLRNIQWQERQKPENRGRNVRYDWKNRCVMVDNHIVDTFRPNFF